VHFGDSKTSTLMLVSFQCLGLRFDSYPLQFPLQSILVLL